MKPAPFDYVRADSVEHAVTQLGEANVDGEGNICRCTGYAGIVDAVRQAAAHG